MTDDAFALAGEPVGRRHHVHMDAADDADARRRLSVHPSQGDLVQQRLRRRRVVARLQLGQLIRSRRSRTASSARTRATLAALSAAGSSRTGKVSK